MARHKKSTDEKYNQPFATRFRILMNTGKRTSQAEIAEAVGKSRQVISQYYNGESEPPYDALVKIAQYFHVTVDYMIGATEVASTSLDVKEIVRQTGISEKNVSSILERNKLAEQMKEIFIRDKINFDESEVNPLGVFLNALIEYVYDENNGFDLVEVISTLSVPSSNAFVKKLEKDEGFQHVIHKDAIRAGVERFFHQEDVYERRGWEMSMRGMWYLSPEAAFEYYCSRVGDSLKEYLIAKFRDTAKWSDIEPYREKLREEIDKIDGSWDEITQEGQRKWPVSKKETEATE